MNNPGPSRGRAMEIAVDELNRLESYVKDLRALLVQRFSPGDSWSEAVEKLVKKVLRTVTVARAVLLDPYADGRARTDRGFKPPPSRSEAPCGTAVPDPPTLSLQLSLPSPGDVSTCDRAGKCRQSQKRYKHDARMESNVDDIVTCKRTVPAMPPTFDEIDKNITSTLESSPHLNWRVPAISMSMDQPQKSRTSTNSSCQTSQFSWSPSSNVKSWRTDMPYHDGHQWKKYGQKLISGAPYPREYYKCSFHDGGCRATKQVQQLNGDDPPLFQVKRAGEHTCSVKPMEFMLDTLKSSQQ